MATPSAVNGVKAPHKEVVLHEKLTVVEQRAGSESDLEKQSEGAPAVDGDAILDEQDSDTAGDDDAPSSIKLTGGLTAVLSRVISRASTKSNPGPPPDGGMKAWITGMMFCRPCFCAETLVA
jgi:hypothetical protein